eukprot:m.170980 g.170980  ORF g.170980 m.170980 type:complete len:287 (-) comp15344_c0_seq1:36-896(-)
MGLGAALPIAAFGLVMVATITGTLVWSSLRNDVYPLLPYISDTGAEAPERSIFSFGLTCAFLLAVVIFWSRYKQLMLARQGSERMNPARINEIALVLGMTSSFGMILVACFQDIEILQVHLVGAFLIYGSFLLYGILDTISAKRLDKFGNESALESAGISSRRYICLRNIIMTLAIGSAGLCVSCGFLSLMKLPKLSNVDDSCKKHIKPWPGHDHIAGKPWPGKWPPCLPGWELHVASAAGEWLLSLLYLLYLASLAPELRRLDFHVLVTSRVRGESNTRQLLLPA